MVEEGWKATVEMGVVKFVVKRVIVGMELEKMWRNGFW